MVISRTQGVLAGHNGDLQDIRGYQQDIYDLRDTIRDTMLVGTGTAIQCH